MKKDENRLFFSWMRRYCTVKKITKGVLLWKKTIGYEITGKEGVTVRYKGNTSKSVTIGTEFDLFDFTLIHD